jgi:hypothetical protein
LWYKKNAIGKPDSRSPLAHNAFCPSGLCAKETILSILELTVALEFATRRLKAALARAGWTERLIDEACEGERLDQFRRLLIGEVDITACYRPPPAFNPNLKMDVGLAWKLLRTMSSKGWTVPLIEKACEGDALVAFHRLVSRHTSIRERRWIIDCDRLPRPKKGERKPLIEQHLKMGQWEWDPTQVELVDILTPAGKWPRGYDVRKQLMGRRVLNACVLEYLLARPWLIPKEWRDENLHVFFWGTIYRWYGATHGTKHFHVRCLRYSPIQPSGEEAAPEWCDSGNNLHEYWRHIPGRIREVAAVLVG